MDVDQLADKLAQRIVNKYRESVLARRFQMDRRARPARNARAHCILLPALAQLSFGRADLDRSVPLPHLSQSPSLITCAAMTTAVAGVPGSGKSTLAVPLTDRVNHLLAAAPSVKGKEKETAVCVGMDGWHYSRAELDLFEVSPHSSCLLLSSRASADDLPNPPGAHRIPLKLVAAV